MRSGTQAEVAQANVSEHSFMRNLHYLSDVRRQAGTSLGF